MEDYAVKNHNDLPPYLYRVVYPGARATFWPFHGIIAELQEPQIGVPNLSVSTVLNLRQTANKSPFVNLFCSYERAQKWAEERMRDRKINVLILTIDTKKLQGRTIFKISRVVDRLRINVQRYPRATRNDIEDGYKCLFQVPAAAIIDAEPVMHATQADLVLSTLKPAPQALTGETRVMATSPFHTPPPSDEDAANARNSSTLMGAQIGSAIKGARSDSTVSRAWPYLGIGHQHRSASSEEEF